MTTIDNLFVEAQDTLGALAREYNRIKDRRDFHELREDDRESVVLAAKTLRDLYDTI